MKASPRWASEGFRNVHPILPGLRNPNVPMPTLTEFLCGGERRVPARPLPSVSPLEEWRRRPGSGLRATWLGHSTVLIEIDGVRVLTDPVWGPRASPLLLAGPKRFQPVPVPLSAMPRVDVVIISHDHYDHLDRETVTRLAHAHGPTFFVPLGLKAWFAEAGIEKVVELDWWQSGRVGPLTITCTPAQHSSGRSVTLTDQNRRLWSSWVIAGVRRRLYFAGDSGYFAGFGEIGRRLGPFDVAALPIGGYSDYPHHHPNHVSPEESVQAFRDLGGRLLVPMHWGTFDLNREPYGEPPDRLLREARRQGLADDVAVLSPGQTIRW